MEIGVEDTGIVAVTGAVGVYAIVVVVDWLDEAAVPFWHATVKVRRPTRKSFCMPKFITRLSGSYCRTIA